MSLEIVAYKLSDPMAKEYYVNNITQDCHSVTLTLNPVMYKADILSQYRAAIDELKKSKIFYYKEKGVVTVHPDFEEFVIIPELTKELNIHFHGYFKCNPEKSQYFYNEFRKFCWKNSVFGRQMTFKQIDDFNETIKGYPFKDIKELCKFPDSKKINIYKFSQK
jgi:hypothetical protein